ncbi:hypothetical protein [Serratia marcescens]|uniref:hypothetical protein n=1 Tax=Serratia marcescens TaxID=615 RepID=UPI000D727FB3|nr:hypothetical protein [Serratia marcescens]AWO81442.1 hypothetical protein C1N78_24170 [Serratia marcescens]
MEELAKAIQSKYIEDLTAKYPLHRFCILFFFIISFYSYSNGNNLVDGIKNLKVSFLFDFEKGLLSLVSIFQVIICLFLTRCTSYFYQKVSKGLFSIMAKAGSFDKYTKELIEKLKDLKTENDLLNFFISKDISQELEKKRIKLKCININGEYSFAFALAMIYGISNWNSFDLLLFIGVFLSFAYTQFISFKYYVEQFMPNYVTEKLLLGTDVNFGDE